MLEEDKREKSEANSEIEIPEIEILSPEEVGKKVSASVGKFAPRPTIIVGLGGSGLQIVEKLKDLLFNFLGGKEKGKQKWDGLPIRTIALDTDRYEQVKVLEKGEYIYLGNIDGDKIISDIKEGDRKKFKEIGNWIPTSLEPGRIDDGAHQVRPNGRLAFFYYFDQEIRPKLENALNDTHTIFPKTGGPKNPTVDVFIVSSFCGGTGSGMFLDTAYILRYLIKNIGCQAKVTGIFFLPTTFDVILSDTFQRERIRGNTYAALQEIEAIITQKGALQFDCTYPLD